MEQELLYNTQMSEIRTGDYGRLLQTLVENIRSEKDRIYRNEYAYAIIDIMISLNPKVKELVDYEKKLWQQLFYMADYDLDVDCPYDLPSKEEQEVKPEQIPYKDELIKFRFYGRNLQQMVEKLLKIEDEEIKKAFLNYIASFMVNSSRNWNDEAMEKNVVVEHLKQLSKGELIVDPDELEIHIENKPRKIHNGPKKTNTNKNKKNYKKKFRKR